MSDATEDSTTDESQQINAMIEFVAGLAPISEMGKGYKATLLADGWTEETAEKVAAELMCALLRTITGQS